MVPVREGHGKAEPKRKARTLRFLPICVTAMGYRRDLHCHAVLGIKEDPVVTAAESKAAEWRFESLHIASAGKQVVIDAMKNFERGVAIDRSKICASLG